MLPEADPAFPLDGRESRTFGGALRGIVNREFLASRNWREQQERANRVGAHPHLLEFEKVFLRRMGRFGVPMFVNEVIRTGERQDDLHALGNSQVRAGQSPHQWGLAADLVHSVRGWQIDRKQWALIGHVGKEVCAQRGLKMDWGGDWVDYYDPAHWQVRGWRDLKGEFPWKEQ